MLWLEKKSGFTAKASVFIQEAHKSGNSHYKSGTWYVLYFSSTQCSKSANSFCLINSWVFIVALWSHQTMSNTVFSQWVRQWGFIYMNLFKHLAEWNTHGNNVRRPHGAFQVVIESRSALRLFSLPAGRRLYRDLVLMPVEDVQQTQFSVNARRNLGLLKCGWCVTAWKK